jgi:hypothetical protein
MTKALRSRRIFGRQDITRGAARQLVAADHLGGPIHLAGQQMERPGSLPNRFGVIALRFERLSGQPAGFGDVGCG